MEKVIAVKLEVDGGESISELEKFENSLQEVNDIYKDIATTAKDTGSKSEKALKELNSEVKKGGKTFAELRQTIELYKDVAIEAGRNSPVGIEALKNAAMLQDQLDGIDAEIRAIAHDGANMQAALQLGTGLLAGYTAFQGVTAMLGVENEELMETMVKLQGAQSVLMGIEQARATLEKESFLMQKAKIVQTKVMTGLQLLYATAVGASTGAMKLFRIALLATGIGAIIVAIGLLIANFEAIVEGIKNVWNAFTNLFTPAMSEAEKADREFTKKNIENNKKRQAAIDEEIKANKKRSDEEEKEFDYRLRLAKANGENTNNLEVEILNARIKRFETERALIIEKLKLIRAEFEERQKLNGFNLKEITESHKSFIAQVALLKETNENLLDAQRDLTIREVEIRKERRDNSKEADKEEIELLEQHFENIKVSILAFKEEMPPLMEIDEDQNERYFTGLLGRLSEFYDTWQHMDTESKLAMAQGALDYSNEILGSIGTIADAVAQGSEMEVARIEKETEAKLKNERLTAIQKYNIERASAEATDKLNKKVFENNKKLQMAQVAIDGASAVVKALATGTTTPIGFVLAASVATATLAQLNAIRKQKYESAATQLVPPSFDTSGADSEVEGGQGSSQGFGGNQTVINNSPTVSVIEINKVQGTLEDINSISIIGG